MMAICRWEEDVANEVLISLTASNLLYLYNDRRTLESKFMALLQAKFPPSDSFKYYTELSTLKQSNFLTIMDYKNAIESTCKKLSVCKNWNNEIEQSKTEECFFNGLSRRTQLEMARLNVKNLKEMFHIIDTTKKP